MAEFLVVRIGDAPQDPAEWIAADSTGTLRSAPAAGSLDEAARQAGDRTVMVLVPGASVLTTIVDIPVKGARLQAALPFALEEYVADDIEMLHFAAGRRYDNGHVPVSVVRRDVLDEWLAMLAEAGLRPATVVSEAYGLARIPGTVSMLIAGDQTIVNDGDDIELVMQGVTPADALTAIGVFNRQGDDEDAQDETKARRPGHVLVYCLAEDEERYQHDWLAIRPELDSLDVKILADGVMPRLAATVASGAGVNLLQGEYGRKTSYAGILRPWRYAAMLLVTLALLGFGGKAADLIMQKRRLADLQQQFLAEYEQLVPGATLPRDPDAIVDSLIARAGGGPSPQIFLTALEHLGRAMTQNESSEIEAISFRAGVLDVRLSAPDVATLDNIQRAVSESGLFTAKIQSTDQEGDKVNSRIQIQAGGA